MGRNRFSDDFKRDAVAQIRLGRPAAMTNDQIEMAKKLKSAGGHLMQAIADQLGVSRSTLYRYIV